MESVSQEQQSELFIVAKEIMSLQRERRELLASLTPGLSVWKGEGNTLLSRFAGKDYTAASDEVLVQEMETESASTEEELGRYFDSILHDMEDLNHRMLSMAHVVVKPDGAAISSYTADELVNSTSRLMCACTELYKDTKDKEQDEEGLELLLKQHSEYQHSEHCLEESEENTFSLLYSLFLKNPLNYQNELALVVTKEEVENYEKMVEKEKERVEQVAKENKEKWKQWQDKQKGKGKLNQDQKEKDENEKPHPHSLEHLTKCMDFSVKSFALHRHGWNTVWGSKSTDCGDFLDKTTLSPMHFTHYTPDTIPSFCVTVSTLQIYSIEILELKEGLKWPLKLYGVVAARDTVDHNRNTVFYRSRLNCQVLRENGSLCLTGPSRAIVALDSVVFEVDLKIEEEEKSKGKELITLSKRYDGSGTSLIFQGSLCKAVLRLGQISTAVQATIVGVCLVDGKWPFEYGCRVACSLDDAPDEVVLLDCWGGSKEAHVGSNDYLHLSRNVVSVKFPGKLKVVILSYSKSGSFDLKWDIDFTVQKCQTTEHVSLAQQYQTTERVSRAQQCRTKSLGTSKVKVVVAWSLLVKEKRDLLV